MADEDAEGGEVDRTALWCSLDIMLRDIKYGRPFELEDWALIKKAARWIESHRLDASRPIPVVKAETGIPLLCYTNVLGWYVAWPVGDEWRMSSPRDRTGYLLAPKPNHCRPLPAPPAI